MNERKTFDEEFAPIVDKYNQEEDPLERINIVTKFGFSIMMSLVIMGMTVDEVVHGLKLFIKSKEEFEKKLFIKSKEEFEKNQKQNQN